MPAHPQSRTLADYADWLGLERFRALREAYGPEVAFEAYATLSAHGAAVDWHRAHPAEPSTRAAEVLAAVGGLPAWEARHG